jgi:hypothetical protein
LVLIPTKEDEDDDEDGERRDSYLACPLVIKDPVFLWEVHRDFKDPLSTSFLQNKHPAPDYKKRV